ncbi:YdiU family protein [Thalassotalea sp. 1_MG-2023]|uniref:protein adenylyltransferase SelO n=1 Tax=Thalassotalea sp. 1_MG-2023 TaxID=3062680 RepID=UPI0026E3855A|nr:YdiU family protein [Thalassotalea sp. 1_MG-2023]MDO6427490.1 YdiU family protein [Thalassotalea sp. 1_MG-2023]
MRVFQCGFNDSFVQQLPADPESENFCRSVTQAAYSFVTPATTADPSLLALNSALATTLTLKVNDEIKLAQIFTGNTLLAGTTPYAMNYGGHQFGHWAGQLGDGRAINLGQLDVPDIGLKTLQLKGAGSTPYSRRADGLAVLRSSIREYLCSEAMHHLGVPTTRALSLCLTGDLVTRDMFYDGHPKEELGAIVCRVSSSFLRFGSFQLPASRGDISLLKQLLDYTITTHFPHLGEPNKASYLAWFDQVADETCQLMVHWMRVGFVHGVMNTDNMSILSETIDYGPYGWIDNFDLNWTPNTTDAQGKRYCFGAQPEIAQWNLFQLANAIYPLIEDAEPLNTVLSTFAKQYEQRWRQMMADKLGFEQLDNDADPSLFIALEKLMTDTNVDMTIFYRSLAKLPVEPDLWLAHLDDCFYELLTQAQQEQWQQWLTVYTQRLAHNSISSEEKASRMNQVNPKYVLRNYLAQQVIEKAEKGDYTALNQLYEVLKSPYQEQPEAAHFAGKRPDWAKHKAGCSMLSCSS